MGARPTQLLPDQHIAILAPAILIGACESESTRLHQRRAELTVSSQPNSLTVRNDGSLESLDFNESLGEKERKKRAAQLFFARKQRLEAQRKSEAGSDLTRTQQEGVWESLTEIKRNGPSTSRGWSDPSHLSDRFLQDFFERMLASPLL